MRELRDVHEWMDFGSYLGIKVERLSAIKMEYSTIQECHLKMLEEWQNDVIPTWSAVVQALKEIGMPRLADDIAHKFG